MVRRITALKTFGRVIRDEPAWGIYQHRIYPTKDKITSEKVVAWLKERYTRKRGLWQVVVYPHNDGAHYVHYFETQYPLTDAELIEVRLRWGWSEKPVKRDGRLKGRKRLDKAQRAQLDALLERVRDDFYNSITTA